MSTIASIPSTVWYAIAAVILLGAGGYLYYAWKQHSWPF